MTDTPRKTLSLKRKPSSEAPESNSAQPITTDNNAEPLTRESRILGKRIIRREETKSTRPTHNSNTKPNKHKNSFTKTKDAKPAKATEPSPSEIQAKAMDRFLADTFEAWQSYKPLALGVEADLYRLMDQNQPPASKRVVQRLLRMHCNHGKYLQAVVDGQQRYNLAGEILGEVSETEREHASRTLKEQEDKKAQH